MSLQSGLQQVEHLERWFGRKSHSRKWFKRCRNKWLRRKPIDEIPNTKERHGWEY